MKKILFLILFFFVSIYYTFSQNNDHVLAIIIDKEIVINNGFAGESLTLTYEEGKYYIYRKIFGSGVPYIGIIKYNVSVSNPCEIIAIRIETISENIKDLYSNDYIIISHFNELEITINDIRKEINYIK